MGRPDIVTVLSLRPDRLSFRVYGSVPRHTLHLDGHPEHLGSTRLLFNWSVPETPCSRVPICPRPPSLSTSHRLSHGSSLSDPIPGSSTRSTGSSDPSTPSDPSTTDHPPTLSTRSFVHRPSPFPRLRHWGSEGKFPRRLPKSPKMSKSWGPDGFL